MIDHTFAVLAYKESEFLETCIKSLLNQSVKSNIIITTSTPNEHIEKISKKYNLPLIINNNGGSIGKDWNFALEAADTEFVTLAHQDDVYTKDYLKEISDAFEKHSSRAIAFSKYHEIRDNEVKKDNLNLKIKNFLLSPLRIGSGLQKSAISLGCAICCPSVTYNKKELEDFKFSDEFKSNLDWDAWVQLDKEGKKFNYIPKPLMLHRIHEESETSNVINENSRREEDIRIFKKIWPSWFAKFLETFYSMSEKSNKNE